MLQRTVSFLVRANAFSRVTLVGCSRDIQVGYIGDDQVVQFQCVTQDFDPVALHTADGALPGKEPKAGGVTTAERWGANTLVIKQQFTVRCYNSSENPEFCNQLRPRLQEGGAVKLVGQLRTNYQNENGKKLPFPFVYVNPKHKGSVTPITVDKRSGHK